MKSETEEWLKISQEEYESAMVLLEKGLNRMVCYHAQQSVEKILKAILTERDIDFSRTHNILDLRNAVHSVGYEIQLTDEDSIFLNSIYRSRYPSAIGLIPSGEPTRADAEKAIDIARIVIESIESFKRER